MKKTIARVCRALPSQSNIPSYYIDTRSVFAFFLSLRATVGSVAISSFNRKGEQTPFELPPKRNGKSETATASQKMFSLAVTGLLSLRNPLWQSLSCHSGPDPESRLYPFCFWVEYNSQERINVIFCNPHSVSADSYKEIEEGLSTSSNLRLPCSLRSI